MRTRVLILVAGLFGLTLIGWHFLKAEDIPPAKAISEIIIVYNAKIGDLLPDDHDSHEFKITDQNEIEAIHALVGNQKITKQPIIDSKIMDTGQNWIINIYFGNGGYRYIYVDKKQISGNPHSNSKLYIHLKENYT